MKYFFVTLIFVTSIVHSEDFLDYSSIENTYIPKEELKVEDYPQISITLLGEKTSYECNLDKAKKIYVCPGKGGILVKSNFFGLQALITDENKNSKVVNVGSAKSGEKILSEQNGSYGSQLGAPFTPANDLTTKLRSQLFDINGFFENYGKPKQEPAVIGSDNYEKIAKIHNDKKQEIHNVLNTTFRENSYQVELDNGQTLNCKRGVLRPLMQSEVDYQKNKPEKLQCGAFKCDDITVDGKKYQASMLYESKIDTFGTTSLHLTDAEGRGPAVTIRKIKSAHSEIPLVDNSRFIDNPMPNHYGAINYGNYQTLANAIPQDIVSDKDISLFKNPGFDATLEYTKNLCSDDLGVIEKIKLARNQALTKLANTELVQLISIINGGTLWGQFIDPNQAANLGCMYGGLYLNAEAAKNLDKIKKNINPDKDISQTIDLDHATRLFNKARAMTDIAWDYKPDGCYARAHLMARRFEAEGIRVDKVWIKGNLYVPEENIGWNFHVAPIVYVKDEKGLIQKMVIDPSLFDKPVTVEEWDKKMTKKTMKGSVVTAFPFPENAAYFERSTLAFSSSDPYLPGDNINMSEEDKLQMANETMIEYKTIRNDKGIYNYPGMPQP